MKLIRQEWRRLGALGVVSVAIFVLAHDLTSLDRWRTPINYEGDAVQILTWIKAASEGDYYPALPVSVERLGAPFGGNWNDFPMYEKCLTVLLGLLAVPLGVFAAGNVSVLLAHATAVLSFYLVCRFLRHRWEWSFVGAVLFGFAYYNSWRGLQHVLLAFTWTAPPALICCAIVARGTRVRLRNGWGKFCLAVACVLGVSNPYNLYMYLQLMAFALLAQWLSARRRENLVLGSACIGAAMVSFLAVNAGTFIYRFQHGANPSGIVRNYYESEQYGLKLLECVVPPASHNFPFLADLGASYGELHKVTGEVHSPYLGIVALGALAWLIVESVARLATVRTRLKPAAHLFQISWIYAYASIGGGNSLAAFGGLLLFRASNRFSLFISALLLLFLVSRLSRASRKLSRGQVVGVAMGLLLVGVADQTPFRSQAADTGRYEARMSDDRDFVERIESELPDRAMIFQIPIVTFPEAPPFDGLEPYELLRPYLHSRQLRFSHGFNRGRSREDWQFVIEEASAAELVRRLEAFGFAGLLIHRNAYSDHGEALISNLQRVGRGRSMVDGSGNRMLVVLQPASNPRTPRPGEFVRHVSKPELVRWDRSENAARYWSSGDFALVYDIPEGEVRKHRFVCELETRRLRTVVIRHNGETLIEGALEPGAPVEVDFLLNSVAGENRIEIHAGTSSSPPVVVEGLPLAVGIVNPRIHGIE